MSNSILSIIQHIEKNEEFLNQLRIVDAIKYGEIYEYVTEKTDNLKELLLSNLDT